MIFALLHGWWAGFYVGFLLGALVVLVVLCWAYDVERRKRLEAARRERDAKEALRSFELRELR